MSRWFQSNTGGVNGSNVAAGSGGSADGSTPYDAANIGASATLIYDNTHILPGTLLAVKCATGASAVACTMSWTTALTYGVPMYASCCYYHTANPASQIRLLSWERVNALAAGINLLTTGQIQGFAGSGTNTTASIPLNSWYRVDLKLVVASATVGQVEVRLFNDPFSSTPTETKTSAATFNTGTGNPDELRIGLASAIANAGPFWMAYPQASNTGYPPPPSTRPYGLYAPNRAAVARGAVF